LETNVGNDALVVRKWTVTCLMVTEPIVWGVHFNRWIFIDKTAS